MNNAFDHPGEAVINVSAPHTMNIDEGFQNVSISIHLVKQSNVTEFKLVKLDCYLGNLKNNRLHIDSSNWKIFDYVADDYQTGMLLYPSQISDEARIQLEMSIEVHYEDGNTPWCDLTTQPIFGLYNVQHRHLPIVIQVTVTLCGVLAVVWLDRRT